MREPQIRLPQLWGTGNPETQKRWGKTVYPKQTPVVYRVLLKPSDKFK